MRYLITLYPNYKLAKMENLKRGRLGIYTLYETADFEIERITLIWSQQFRWWILTDFRNSKLYQLWGVFVCFESCQDIANFRFSAYFKANFLAGMNWNKLSQICCECNFWQYKTNDFAKIRFVNFATMIFQCNGTPLRHQTRPTSNITKKVPILNFRPIGIKWTETQTTSWTCTTPRGIKNSRTGLGRSGGRTFYDDSWQWGLEWGPFSIPGP